MNIIKVIVNRVPLSCRFCYHIETRERGRAVAYECYFVEGWIENTETRPNWCPLAVNNGATVGEIAKHYEESKE